jgi:molybdopterin converting factor small subunit
MKIKVKYVSVIAKKIGNSEEIISLDENSPIDELLKIVTIKYKKSLKDYITFHNGDYVFSRFVRTGIQRGGEGKVCMIDYMDGVETILNKGDVVFIYYAMAGG